MRSVVAGFCLAAVLAGVSAAPQTLASLISNNPNLTTFNELLTATGLTTLLASQSGLTVFGAWPAGASARALPPFPHAFCVLAWVGRGLASRRPRVAFRFSCRRVAALGRWPHQWLAPC